MKKLICILIIIFSCLSSAIAKEPDFDCASYVLVDVTNENELIANNIDYKFKPNDFSKLMTAIIALEESNENTLFTVKPDSFKHFVSTGNLANLKEGEKLILNNLLYPMIFLSSDEAANTVALGIKDNLKEFTDLMNNKASKLGMKNTHFSSPNGYDPDNKSYTTTQDISKLCLYALKNKILKI